jgi:hypothetical protein
MADLMSRRGSHWACRKEASEVQSGSALGTIDPTKDDRCRSEDIDIVIVPM